MCSGIYELKKANPHSYKTYNYCLLVSIFREFKQILLRFYL